MNAFALTVFCLAVSTVSAGHLGFGGFGYAGHGLGLAGHGLGLGGHGFGLGGLGGHGGYGLAYAAPVVHAVAPINPAAHIASGSVSVGPNGAVVAGPSGSVKTDNGLHGHGAGAKLSGPAGEIGTSGGHATLSGPGIGGHGYGHGGIVAAAPAVIAAPAYGHAGGYLGFGGHGLVGGHGFYGGHGHGHGW